MKNILITGGTGFLGSYIARRLVNDVDSITIVTLDIKQKTSLKALDIDMNKIRALSNWNLSGLKRLFMDGWHTEYVESLKCIIKFKTCLGFLCYVPLFFVNRKVYCARF